jgi:hypothetical protein
LQTFLNDPTLTQGLEISSQSLSINPGETDQILIGSYILFDCKSGYTNTDNNLNVVCNANGQWSTFPGCIALTTTIAPGLIFMYNRINLSFISFSHITDYYTIEFR